MAENKKNAGVPFNHNPNFVEEHGGVPFNHPLKDQESDLDLFENDPVQYAKNTYAKYVKDHIKVGDNKDQRGKARVDSFKKLALSSTGLLACGVLYNAAMAINGDEGLALFMASIAVGGASAAKCTHETIRFIENAPGLKSRLINGFNNIQKNNRQMHTFAKNKIKPFVKESINTLSKTSSKTYDSIKTRIKDAKAIINPTNQAENTTSNNQKKETIFSKIFKNLGGHSK